MTDLSDTEARRIATDLLEITRSGMLNGDFTSFFKQFQLPQTIMTFDGKTEVHTPEAFRKIFDDIRRYQHSLGVTDIVRYCVAASFKGPDRIETTHMTHLLSGERQLSASYPTFSVLSLIDGDWRIILADYAVEPGSHLSRVLLQRVRDAETQPPGPSDAQS